LYVVEAKHVSFSFWQLFFRIRLSALADAGWTIAAWIDERQRQRVDGVFLAMKTDG
jgi:hypothetical protein